MRAVYQKSLQISKDLRRSDYAIPPSRLHEYERGRVVPSIFRLYTMAHVYGCSIHCVMGWYGIPQG